ncbi:alpha/beta hydrolase [Streptococcus ovuberis]|uniref:Alpha/beta hydrolase n=1 Tax=Streptococcus ovuberis TaxID=1936207 RepID=A0A7X6S0F4_9STRE|nr:alpha/beta hydrolase [Streptococcus ovuberis]NKZ19727.1 alpha/beta hydrolase [Streptococcus ovuberis]
MAQQKQSKRLWKILGLILASLIGLFSLLAGAIALKPQLAISVIQSALYPKGNPINPTEPLNPPSQHVKENGIYYRNDIDYGSTYPNSFLDISYPSEDTNVDRPTIIYFHGGGFFGGDKAMGDPLAVNNDSSYLFDRLVQEGYNLVNINYVLVPDYHFPDPIVQMNEAVNYLVDHQTELGLNMDRVIFFGQSAGAIMVGQYGAILSNPDYRALYPLTQDPKLTSSQVQATVIDDAPFQIPSGNLALDLMISNYLDDNLLWQQKELLQSYNPIPYLTADYPPSIMLAGTADGFPEDMRAFSDKLSQLDVTNTYFHTDEETYGLTAHGYLSNLKYDKTGAAQAAYETILDFISQP